MGWRYRKSINLGGGFRINLSKSGIGYSWGVKGYRITKTAKGNVRKTVSIPGTGISYVEESGKKRKNATTSGASYETGRKSTEKIAVDEYQPAEYETLLNEIKRIQNINLLSNVLIFTFLFIATPIFILTGIIGVALKVYTHFKLPIPLEYEFDEDAERSYKSLCSVWLSLNLNEKFWQTISETAINKKVSGGASRGVTRIPVKAISKLPYFIKANVKPFGLKLRKQKLFFLPDKLLVVSGRKVGAINYSDLRMQFGTTNFVETEKVPKDATIISRTWLKVNKNGSPDKRFKNNRQVPVCKYGKILITSGDKLHIELMCSNADTIDDMRIYAREFFKS